MRGIRGSKAWAERANALLAVHLQVENMHHERIAFLRPINEKRAR